MKKTFVRLDPGTPVRLANHYTKLSTVSERDTEKLSVALSHA